MHTAFTSKLLNAADILEKTAAYIDSVEHRELEEKNAQIKEQVIDPVKDQLDTVGIELDEGLAEKLGNSDPEVQKLVQKLAESNNEYDPSLGGPSDYSTKQAAVGDDGEEDALLEFCLS